MIADTYHAFENYIAKIFKKAGFSITQNVPVSEIKNSGDIDIVAVKDEKGRKYHADTPADLFNRMKFTLDLLDELNNKYGKEQRIAAFSFPMHYTIKYTGMMYFSRHGNG